MSVFLMAVLAGAATGVLSGFGVGGGTLLILWLTFLGGYDQISAQGINLLYFLPTSAAALVLHWKNGYIPWKKAVLPAALAGCVTAGLGAWAAGGLDTGLLRRLFGGYLLILGLAELFRKKKSPSE